MMNIQEKEFKACDINYLCEHIILPRLKAYNSTNSYNSQFILLNPRNNNINNNISRIMINDFFVHTWNYCRRLFLPSILKNWLEINNLYKIDNLKICTSKRSNNSCIFASPSILEEKNYIDLDPQVFIKKINIGVFSLNTAYIPKIFRGYFSIDINNDLIICYNNDNLFINSPIFSIPNDFLFDINKQSSMLEMNYYLNLRNQLEFILDIDYDKDNRMNIHINNDDEEWKPLWIF